MTANEFNENSIRATLERFWSDALEIGSTPRGYSLALPQTLPDGWQLVVDLEAPLPRGIKLTDKGRVLAWLQAGGQNVETDSVKRHLNLISEQSGFERDGFELYRWLPEGLDAVDLHVFAEGLINVAHLHYLHEPKPRSLDVPDQTLRRVFIDHKVEAEPNRILDGLTRRKIRLDYYIPSQTPAAFHIIRRHGRIIDSMEQWGFRWHDLRAKHPSLRPAMIYNPHEQEIDDDSRAIGEECCELFCSYEEVERIHEFLG